MSLQIMDISYRAVAAVYDDLMSEVDYDTWFEHYMRILSPGESWHVLEIGAGTGNFTNRLAHRCAVHAVEPSENMISIAKEKALNNPGKYRVTYECAGMENFSGLVDGEFQAFDAAVAVFDVMNCVDLQTFRKSCVHIASKLKRGARFVFDVNTEMAFLMHLFDEDCEDLESGYSHVWRGVYDPEMHREDIEMKYYRQGKLWFTEHQVQWAHSRVEIAAALEHAGFERISFMDAATMAPPVKSSDRWLVAASLGGT